MIRNFGQTRLNVIMQEYLTATSVSKLPYRTSEPFDNWTQKQTSLLVYQREA